MSKKVFKSAKDILLALVEKCKQNITENDIKNSSVSNIGSNQSEMKEVCEKTSKYIKEYGMIKECKAIHDKCSEAHKALLKQGKQSTLCTTLSSIVTFSEEVISKGIEQRKTGKAVE